MRILHISYECYPFAKVGGMADVVGALPKYQADAGADAAVAMPKYIREWEKHGQLATEYEGQFHLGPNEIGFQVQRLDDPDRKFATFLIDIPGLFDRPDIYGYRDDVYRSITFQRALLTWLKNSERAFDVLHCHDHHTGLIPFMAGSCDEFASLSSTPVYFTIHNAAYQGAFSWDLNYLLPAYPADRSGLLDWNDAINPLASALKCSWGFNTVSEGYLNELFRDGHGLEWLVRNEGTKASGILNGIDTDVWNPASDPLIPAHLKRSNKVFKRKNKEHYCKEFNLDPAKPLFIFIGRLAYEKGADMLGSIAGSFLSTYDDVNFVLLGSGDPTVEGQFHHLQQFFPQRLRAHITYSEPLAHRLYAACDFLLMPSRVEPCGLNQMYTMRYGGIPIVRAIGGLRDTVLRLGPEGGNGFVFDHLNVQEVMVELSRARELFADTVDLARIRSHNMAVDFSWISSAKRYIEAYERASATT